MTRYLLLLRDDPETFEPMSPTEIQAIIERYASWSEDWRLKGKLTDGLKLKDGVGRTLRRDGDRLAVKDGPFTAVKEVVGGLFVLDADDEGDALEIARSCPHLDYGSVELREVEET